MSTMCASRTSINRIPITIRSVTQILSTELSQYALGGTKKPETALKQKSNELSFVISILDLYTLTVEKFNTQKFNYRTHRITEYL